MKFKILILSFMSIVLIAGSAFLASISVNPENISGSNAKREYTSAIKVSESPSEQSGSQTVSFRNAKRENM